MGHPLHHQGLRNSAQGSAMRNRRCPKHHSMQGPLVRSIKLRSKTVAPTRKILNILPLRLGSLLNGGNYHKYTNIYCNVYQGSLGLVLPANHLLKLWLNSRLMPHASKLTMGIPSGSTTTSRHRVTWRGWVIDVIGPLINKYGSVCFEIRLIFWLVEGFKLFLFRGCWIFWTPGLFPQMMDWDGRRFVGTLNPPMGCEFQGFSIQTAWLHWRQTHSWNSRPNGKAVVLPAPRPKQGIRFPAFCQTNCHGKRRENQCQNDFQIQGAQNAFFEQNKDQTLNESYKIWRCWEYRWWYFSWCHLSIQE